MWLRLQWPFSVSQRHRLWRDSCPEIQDPWLALGAVVSLQTNTFCHPALTYSSRLNLIDVMLVAVLDNIVSLQCQSIMVDRGVLNGHKFVCLFTRWLDGGHRLADIGTRCPWWGQTLVGTTPAGQRANPRFLPHPSTSDEHIWSQPGSLPGHTHLCPAQWVAPTLGYHSQRGRASAYTSYTENSVWPHFESILPGVPPPTQAPKHTTPTHADAPHYPPPPLIQQIRKVGDVFAATFTLSVHTPIISNIAIIAIIIIIICILSLIVI